MVRAFAELSNHRRHVLEWYRYSLKNIKANVPTDNLRIELYNTFKETVRRNKNHKAGWYVRGLLEDLSLLNKHIVDDDIGKLAALLKSYLDKIGPLPAKVGNLNVPVKGSSVMNKLDTLTKIEKKQQVVPISGSDDLYRYLLKNYNLNGPTKTIPSKYINQLLRPLAIHEKYSHILYKLEHLIAKGPPKVSINYTNAGQSRIWFIRAPFNRKARQSKRLTGIIIKARLKAQDNLDRARQCETDLLYAYQEAQWEYTLVNNQPYPKKFSEVVALIKSGKLGNVPNMFVEWIKPIFEQIDILNKINNKTQQKFVKSRDQLVDGQQYQYFNQLNQQIYQKRLKRFQGLKAELHTTNPFTKENNLGALLVKWKFMKPNQLSKLTS